MSLLLRLSPLHFAEYVTKNYENLPPFIDLKTKTIWKNTIYLFRDKPFLEQQGNWKDIFQKLLTKYESVELDVIKREYNELYNKYMSKYTFEDKKPLRYIIYRHGFESEFNDILVFQRQDDTLPYFKSTEETYIYPGNPYLYSAPEKNGMPDLDNLRFMHQYKLESFLDAKISLSDFSKARFNNPSFGVMANKMNVGYERELLYVILKAYNQEPVYEQKIKEEEENQENSQDTDDDDDDEIYNSQDDS
jgi:hypothetical protein